MLNGLFIGVATALVLALFGALIGPYFVDWTQYRDIVEERADGTVGLSKPTDPPVTRRQDAPRCWDINGAVYVYDRVRYAADPRVLYPDTRLYEMPEERSLDIDTEADWRVVEGVWG